MKKFLKQAREILDKVYKKLSIYISEIRGLLQSDHRELTLVGLTVLGLQLIVLCCCFSMNLHQADRTSPTLSSNDVSSTIISRYIEETKLAPTNTNIPKIPTMLPSMTTEPTKDQVSKILDMYECLPKDTEKIYGKVIDVVDGDTIEVKIGLETYILRYIGIDCPESGNSLNSDNFYGKDALLQNQKLVEGKEVLLIKDVSDVDKYGRLLRYVFVDSDFINYVMVKKGFAHSIKYSPDVACSNFFDEAQNQASQAVLGFWATNFLAPTKIPEPTRNPRAGCDSCYPTVCIPEVGYDLDCGDISFRRFQVDCDPHGFDRDNDGIGCESK